MFRRLLDSIYSQTYKDVKLIIGYDRDESLSYIPHYLITHKVEADQSLPYFYDLYVNQLIEKVIDGWFVVIDDDDLLTRSTILEELIPHLRYPYEAIICQFLRNGNPKPQRNYIKNKVIAEGKIGLPCLVLHSKHRGLSALDGQKAGDYRYIKAVVDAVPTKFIALPLVSAGPRSHGAMEPATQNFQNIQK